MIRSLLFSALALSLSATGPAPAAHWDFEQETPTLEQGWASCSDQIAAGTSFIRVSARKDGPNQALQLSGRAIGIEAGPAAGIVDPFVCAIRYLGATPSRPADFSGATTLSFRIKGRSQVVEVALFQDGQGARPSIRPVKVTPEWTEYRIPMASFGLDTSRLTAVAIGRSTAGSIDVLVDDIRMQ
ncbi:MAG: hypothetical protein HGA66_18425 [Holophaga sp.]|nr:hypothetical protein [Holophaga sp.]